MGTTNTSVVLATTYPATCWHNPEYYSPILIAISVSDLLNNYLHEAGSVLEN
jgi:hypothetical protein